MKRCPKCRKDYLDDSLLYCLDDGALLVQGSISDEPVTAILSGDDDVSPDGPNSSPKGPERDDSRVSADPLTSTHRLRRSLPWIIAGILAISLALVIGLMYLDRSATSHGAIRLSFRAPDELSMNDVQPDYAIVSPDGKKIAFSANGADGKNMLYVGELESANTVLLAGSENPIEPFWSPDSRSVAYGSNGKLKRSDLSGGNAQVVCDAARIVGGSWSKDGTIIFAPDYRSLLVQVNSTGGEPKPVAINGESGDAERHRYPYFLPDGRHFVFYREQKGVWAGSLDSSEIVQIVPDITPAVYARPGYLIFIRNEVLVAQAFDVDKLSVSGEVVPVIGNQKSWINNFRFSASDTGILLWQGVWERDYQLTWFDREGKQTGVVESQAKIAVGQDPQLSPDGKRLVIKRNPPNTIWVIDIEKGTSVPITSGFGQLPVWSPDGSRIAYSGGTTGMQIKNSNGLGEPETLLTGAVFPHAWSPDGRYIIFLRRGIKSQRDMYSLALEGENKETLLLNSQFDEASPELSPNGKWLAYAANDTGTYEIYVQSFSDGSLRPDRKRVSTAGGRMPVWRRDSGELFFVSGDGHLMATTVNASGGEFDFGPTKALFKARMLGIFGGAHEFDVSLDGQRFLIGTLIGDSKAAPPTVILNWTALVKE